MLVAVIADTHLPRGSRSLPGACVQRLLDADLILHAGDLSSLSFFAELNALGPPVRAVYGNADEPALRAELPKELILELDEARIALVHIPGPQTGREARLAARFPSCQAVVYGHTHLPRVDRHEGVWILNPGSPTERRRGPIHSMLLLEIGGAGGIEPELVTL